jgi:serine/threonine protein kinase
VDARSDLYAVGAVGHFLLTGRPLFVGRSVAEVLFQQVNAEPKPPSANGGHAVSPELESLLLRCLAKEPADRPESARALAERRRPGGNSMPQAARHRRPQPGSPRRLHALPWCEVQGAIKGISILKNNMRQFTIPVSGTVQGQYPRA